MTLQQNAIAHRAMQYKATPINKPNKKGIQIIGDMPSHRILSHLAYRHRVGLLMTTVFSLVFYIAWDKVLNAFF